LEARTIISSFHHSLSVIDEILSGVTTWHKRKTFRYLYINRELKVTLVFHVKERD
jgi:hypothetical protein